MTRRILVGIAGLLICAAAFAAGTSIWNAAPRGTVAGTDRLPVATSGSSGPLYVTPGTIKTYIESSDYFAPRAIQVVGVDETVAGSFAAYNACVDASQETNVGCEGLQIVTDASEGWMQVVAIPSDDYPDVSVAVTPAGVGSLSAAVADGTSTGGNNRGKNAVDWQTVRSDQLMVASGSYSTISGGEDNTATGQHATVSGGTSGYASGTYSVVSGGSKNISTEPHSVVSGGNSNTASAESSVVGGGSSNVASGEGAVISGGDSNIASGAYSWIPGGAGSDTHGVTYAFAYGGDYGQTFGAFIGADTTDGTPTVLSTVAGSIGPAYTVVLPTNSVAACAGVFVVTDATDAAGFECKAVAKNIAGTTTLVTGACVAIGTPDASLATVAMGVQANNTDDTIETTVTGIAATTLKTAGELKCSTTSNPDA